ncbi:MAG: site-specific integrase [Oscillospiraceae bacterium]|nr:site-specific integrase [Oscillospiraceae bacterium]
MKKRPDGRWMRKLTLPDGTKKYFYSSESTEKKAIRDIEQQLLAFSEKKSESSRFCAVAERWEKEHFPDLGYNTACKYARCLKRLIPHFGDVPIANIEAADVNAFLKDMKKKGYARDTVSIHKSVLSQIFDFAIFMREVSSNPCLAVSVPKDLPKTRREPPTPEEIKTILASADKHFGVYALTALLTGMRREELLALTDKDIDFANRTILINKTVIWTPNQPQISVPKTKSSTREVHLPELLVPHLQSKSGYIFGNGDKPLSQTQFRHAYARYQKETGLTVTSHQLRHGYASMLYDAEVDIKTAQAQLGHSKASTTQDIYTHIWNARQKKQMNRLENYLSTLSKP